MLDQVPLDPLLDLVFRQGADRLPYYYGLGILYGWNVYKWDRNRKHGRRRDGDIQYIKDYLGLTPRMPEFIKSPNYTKGRLFQKIDGYVIHSMAGNMEPSIRHFQNPKSEVSAHHLIGHDGRHVQMVDEHNTAWHAGNFMVNARKIGIELEGGLFPDGHVDHLGDAGYVAAATELAKGHRERGWGEPSSRTIEPHRKFKATACPSGVDMDRLIQLTQDIYHNRRSVPVVEMVEEPKPQPSPQVVHYETEPFVTNLEPSQVYRAEVRRVQEFLVRKGFMAAPDSASWGYYGKRTQAAIDKFQKANGIYASSRYYGFWFDKTREAANNQLN